MKIEGKHEQGYERNSPDFESRGYYKHEDGKSIGCLKLSGVIFILMVITILYLTI